MLGTLADTEEMLTLIKKEFDLERSSNVFYYSNIKFLFKPNYHELNQSFYFVIMIEIFFKFLKFLLCC